MDSFPALQPACACGSQSAADEEEKVHRCPAQSLSTVGNCVVARMIRPSDIADSRPVGEIPGAIEKTKEQPAKSEEVALKGADGATPQEHDIHMEDSGGKVVAPTWRDFHTVGGPTDGDPLPKDSDEFYTKNGARKIYGPGTALSFKPVPKDQALSNDPSETPLVGDDGKPIYKVRSNFTDSCCCLPCPKQP
jgi:hypothetical protein